ncbi:hypothetical protein DFS33DRAFT_1440416 [Desarmillaria ectypa]|nr:hypothetical protein DFS33DRAFT_1440416 [Desarmillaria ectypa]
MTYLPYTNVSLCHIHSVPPLKATCITKSYPYYVIPRLPIYTSRIQEHRNDGYDQITERLFNEYSYPHLSLTSVSTPHRSYKQIGHVLDISRNTELRTVLVVVDAMWPMTIPLSTILQGLTIEVVFRLGRGRTRSGDKDMIDAVQYVRKHLTTLNNIGALQIEEVGASIDIPPGLLAWGRVVWFCFSSVHCYHNITAYESRQMEASNSQLVRQRIAPPPYNYLHMYPFRGT